MSKLRGSENVLNDKQQAFVREYVVDLNGTQAAIRAGYSPKTADVQAAQLLAKFKVREAVDAELARIATKTETEAEWVRRRLKEEADDFTEFASHSARIKALELIGRINGVFEVDNRQQATSIIHRIELASLDKK